MMHKIFLIAIFFYGLSIFYCESQTLPPSSLAIGGGSSTYFGELNPYVLPISSIFGSSVRWNISANYEKPLTNKISAKIGFSYIRIFGDDNLIENVVNKELNYIRNLHFRNDIEELSFKMVYHPTITPRRFAYRKNYRLYFTGGVSVFHHNPIAKDVRDFPEISSDWVNLRPLKTEGQVEPYSPFGVSFPLGIGLKYRLGKYLDLSAEATFNFTLTDYLDDVSKEVDINNQSALANRTLELTAAYSGKDRSEWLINYLNNNGYSVQEIADIPFQFGAGIPPFDKVTPRGNPNVKDSYLLTKVSVIFYFTPPVKCPKLR